MKKSLFAVLSLVCSMTVFSQTANEIVSQMEAYVNSHEQEGVSFSIDKELVYVDSYNTGNGQASAKKSKLSSGSIFINNNKMRVDSDNGTEFINLDINRKWFVSSNNKEVQFDFTGRGDGSRMNDYYSGLHFIRPAYRFSIKDETDDTTIRKWVKKIVPTYQMRNADGTLPIDRSYDNKPHKWEPTND